jgi:hypothetical protein
VEFFFLSIGGGSEISGVPPSQVYLNGIALTGKLKVYQGKTLAVPAPLATPFLITKD